MHVRLTLSPLYTVLFFGFSEMYGDPGGDRERVVSVELSECYTVLKIRVGGGGGIMLIEEVKDFFFSCSFFFNKGLS